MFRKSLAFVLTLAMVLAVSPVLSVAVAAEGSPITIELLMNAQEAGIGNEWMTDNFVEQYIRENLGADINYVYTDDIETTLNMRLLSDDVPDIMRVPNRNYLIEYANEEYLLNLDEYADQLADAFAFTNGSAAGKVNGITYAIAGRPYGFRQAWWYNVNAFNQAGITELPTTLEGYIDAVRTVMAADIDGNGVNDTLGLTGAGWTTLGRIFGAYGCTVPNILSVDAEGNLVDTMLTGDFYDALSYCAQLWKEGVIDSEIFAQNGSQADDKAKTAQATTLYTQWPGIKKVATWDSYLAIDPNAQWEIVGELVGPDGVSNFVGDYAANGYTSLFSLDADLVEKPEVLNAALSIVNFFGTEEGLSLTTHGIEGQHWDYNEEGAPVVRPESYNDIVFSWVYQMCGREEMSYCRVKFGDYAWKYVVQSHEQPYINNVTSLIDDPDWYNGTDAETYITEECAKFLTGTRELNEAEWQKFIDTLDNTYQYTKFIAEANETWQSMAG